MADTSTEGLRDQALSEQANRGHKMIWVTFRKEGLHKYPAALDDPKLAWTQLRTFEISIDNVNVTTVLTTYINTNSRSP